MRIFETLDPRLMLAADFASMRDLLASGGKTVDVDALFSSAAYQASDAGSSFASALDLGQLSGTRQLAGSVGGIDTSDVMKFSLAAKASVALGLGGLRADIDLFLYNASGQRIGTSNKAGTSSESVSTSLAAGVYYIVVAPWRAASSVYTLSTSVTFVQAPTVPTAPTAPASPTSGVAPFADVAYYGGSSEWNLNSMNAPEVWAQGYTGEGVVVAVIDTGVDMNHPDLVNQLWVNADDIVGNGLDDDHNGFVDDAYGWDFAASDNNPDDGNGHGTHVAGTIAAARNGSGATGVAPDATIMPVRVLDSNGSGTAQSVAAGIRYAAQNGADIINLSLGGAFSSVIQSAIQFAQQLNVLVVAAAGNEYAATPGYPARFSASLNNVLSVGAYSSSNQIAAFSNDVGTSGAVQVDAPGVSVYSTYINDRYGSLSGTSMATPHVAGLAALALSTNLTLTASALRTLIVNGANHTISGSDARGGINAALTVALAAAGQVSTSTSAAAAQFAASSQGVSIRRFNVSGANAEDASSLASAATVRETTWDFDLENQDAVPPRSELLHAAHDSALAAIYSALSADEGDEGDEISSPADADEWLDSAGDLQSVLSASVELWS